MSGVTRYPAENHKGLLTHNAEGTADDSIRPNMRIHKDEVCSTNKLLLLLFH